MVKYVFCVFVNMGWYTQLWPHVNNLFSVTLNFHTVNGLTPSSGFDKSCRTLPQHYPWECVDELLRRSSFTHNEDSQCHGQILFGIHFLRQIFFGIQFLPPCVSPLCHYHGACPPLSIFFCSSHHHYYICIPPNTPPKERSPSYLL